MPRTLWQAAGFLLGLWIALQLAPLTLRWAEAAGPASGDPGLERALHEAVNALRADRNLVALRRDGDLDAVARTHAADMAERGYLSHQSPEGADPVDRLYRGGVAGFTLAAENIGRTDESPPNQRILDAWLASHEHRRNLLTAAFNTTGLAVVRAPDGALVYTQVYVTYPR